MDGQCEAAGWIQTQASEDLMLELIVLLLPHKFKGRT